MNIDSSPLGGTTYIFFPPAASGSSEQEILKSLGEHARCSKLRKDGVGR